MIISDGINHGKLQTIIVGELKKAGLKHRLKKIILKSVRDNKTVFGAPLSKVPSCSVICCGSTINIPTVVNEMSVILRNNAHIEGIFRKAGSQNRQKDIKRLLDSGGCVSEGHHPIDVASVLKLYLRTLPEPLISAEVQDLLLRCRVTAEGDALEPILHTLLLLPVLHVHLLHYIMELLNFIATKNKSNLMNTSNLAIVMAPSIMPLPVAASAQRLEHHVALVKLFIENSQHIGILSDELMSQLDDDSEACLLRRKKRRSGSLNRVFHGLRKMVSATVNTPATVRESGYTPILTKSASKRKMDAYDGLSAKTRKEIINNLPQKELLATPMKMGITEKKRIRLSLNDAKSTQKGFARKYETNSSSEDLLTSSAEHLFSNHDTIDLSPDAKQTEKDYVKISKHEYEEIKSRVSAIENRLSREFTDVTNVEPIQQVQDVYEQTLEEVAMLHCPNSDQLARRLSKELKIRPTEQNKIIRSPSARKIGTIRRRSKENVTKIVRHKSWNASQASQACAERFYPYVPASRNRGAESKNYPSSVESNGLLDQAWSMSDSENSLDNSDSSHKYNLRKRISDAFAYKNITTRPSRRSVNVTTVWDSRSESSMNSTLNCSDKTQPSPSINGYMGPEINSQRSPQQKWKNAATFFMTRTGEIENGSQTGRPSVNKLRRQNAGAVLAKAKMFESSSDRSSDRNNEKVLHTGFARKPRISGVTNNNRNSKIVATVKPRMYLDESKSTNAPKRPSRLSDNPPAIPARTFKPNLRVNDIDWRQTKKVTPPAKKLMSPPHVTKTPPSITPVLKKSLVSQRHLRTPNFNNDTRKQNTPLRGLHTSPRRRSPRQKYQHQINVLGR